MTRPTPLLLPLLAVLFAALAAAWWVPNRPQATGPELSGIKLNSVSFAPFREGQSPLTDTFPTPAQAEEDVALLAPHVRALRTYASLEGAYDVAALAERHGLKVWQGIWLGADRAKNLLEMDKAIDLARRYPDTIERVIVGNEVLLRRDLPPAELIADIDRVRAAVRQPVTYADVWEFWEQFPEVARHVDVVTIHLLPYWEDQPSGIDRAVAHVDEVYHRMAALFPGKPIAIGETGWPSRGRWREDAAPSVVAQATFLREFIALAQREGFDYNLIEAFDQLWKYHDEGVVGANWGVWRADRTLKIPLKGLVAERPDWWKGALAGAGFALLLLTFGLAQGALSPGGQLRLGAIASGLGAALGFAWFAADPDLYDVHARIAGVANLGGQTVLAMLVVARLAARLSGRPVAAARSGADAVLAVRAVARLRIGPAAWWLDDLSFVFLWTAAVEQMLLVFDPRYRDFPLGPFVVPMVGFAARALAGDLPVRGGGRGELLVGLALAGGAVASVILEGTLNRQALTWDACAFVLALVPLARYRVRLPAPAIA